MQPPQGLIDKVRGLKKLKSIADSRPKTVSRGACQEIVLTGDDIDLDLLPIQRCWPGDPGAVHHAARRDHEGSAERRPQRRHVPDAEDRRPLDLHALAAPQGRPRRLPRDRRPASRSRSRSGSTRSPPTRRARRCRSTSTSSCSRASSRASRSSSSRRRRSTSRCPRTPRSSSRASIEKGEVGLEGPFGDHTGYYTAPEPFPIFRLTAITMRRDAIYPSIVVGKPPQEDAWLGKATERIFLPAVRLTVPEIVDYDLPVAGAFHNCVIVSIRKAFPGHAQQGDARDLGARDAQPLEGDRRRRRARERARLRGGVLLRRRERRPEARRRAHRGPARPPRPRADAPVRRAARSASTRPRRALPRARASGRRRSR